MSPTKFFKLIRYYYLFFETNSTYVSLFVLELTYVAQVGLLSAEIKALCYHTWPHFNLFNECFQ